MTVWVESRIHAVKASTSFVGLCRGFPSEFCQSFNLVHGLAFAEQPQYARSRTMFREVFVGKRFVYHYAYDWIPGAQTTAHPGQIVSFAQAARRVSREESEKAICTTSSTGGNTNRDGGVNTSETERI
jgi:hypothetical protein